MAEALRSWFSTALTASRRPAGAERIPHLRRAKIGGLLHLFGERRLHRALDEYVTHYNAERPHQGIGNELVSGWPPTGRGDVVVNELGGLLKRYRRCVA